MAISKLQHHPIPKPLQCIAILGPTCSWKSDVSVCLAEKLHTEVLSCDSMQVYRGMDIGTAKPGSKLRCRVRHHLLDILDISEPYNASEFVERAGKIIATLTANALLPILAGGTGLYAKALLYGLEMHPADRRLNQELCAEYQKPGGWDRLLAEIAAASPSVDCPRVFAANPRRLIRAVEVLRLTGTLPTLNPVAYTSALPGVRQFIIIPEPGLQRERITARTVKMLEQGWITEAEALLSKGLLQTPTAHQALGYRDIGDYLNGDIPDIDKLTATLITRTVHYARRQRTWFRHQHPGAEMLHVDKTTTASQIADHILGKVR